MATRTPASSGLSWGGVGVVAFSLSLPATRAAVAAFDPIFLAAARAAGAGLLAALLLRLEAAPGPTREEWRQLAPITMGVVIGFPLLTSVAMTRAGAVQGAILTGLLPAATAVAAVVLARERPSLMFWLAALAGLLCVVVFAAVQGAGHPGPADLLLLLLSVALAAIGYAMGGVLSRSMGGVRVIGWALVLGLPITLPLTLWTWDARGIGTAPVSAWAGLVYVTLVSQYFGFFAWYRGLAQGGVARIGQLQLAQPVLSLGWAALLLHETVSVPAAVAAVAVIACVIITQRAR